MSETIAEYIVNLLGDKISPDFIAFIISMLPILELRGGLVAAKIMEIDFFRAFAICYLGNMLPIPFILLFIRKIFSLLKRIPSVEKTISNLEARSIRKADKVKKYRLWGLLIFVGIPLPGTGAWTGALVADLLDIRIKHSLPVIALGVLIAGVIISALSYGLFGLLGF
jgi:uncharacterized membrane protein